MRSLLAVVFALSVSGCQGQTESGKRALQKLEDDKKARAEKLRKDEEAEKQRLNPTPSETAKLGPPWDEAGNTLIVSEGPCPEGLWALFPGDPPGKTPEEKLANKDKRADYVKALKDRTFLVKLRSPDQVVLKPFDAPKGEFPVEVDGSLECVDAQGHVSIAWTAAKAGDPGNSAAKEGSEITQHYWMAPKIAFTLPMKTMADAKEFNNKNRIGLSARVVFKLGKPEVDKKLKKVAKVTEKAFGETISIGGGMEDWGAGRLVRAEMVGLRVAVDHEKTQLFEKRGNAP